jgi:hypothetical protein
VAIQYTDCHIPKLRRGLSMTYVVPLPRIQINGWEVNAMGSHQLLVVTAEQKQVEKRICDLDRWVARERDPQIARILRHEIDLLHLEWHHLKDRVTVETLESEPQATRGPRVK